jgi:tetratricopeptide (TPR) repeat protein
MAIDRKPDCEGAYNVLIRALFASARHREAVALADRAVEASGDDYNVYIPLVNAFSVLGDTASAVKFRELEMAILLRQLETVPEDVRARILLSADYAALGKSREAVAELEKAVSMRPGDPDTLYNAACTYGCLNMKAEALSMFRRSVEVGYSNPDWASQDSDLACIHGDPEFKRILRENLRHG